MSKIKTLLVVLCSSILCVACYSHHKGTNTPHRESHHYTFLHHRGVTDEHLYEELHAQGAIVVHKKHEARILMPASANFKNNSHVVQPALKHMLDITAQIMKSHRYSVAEVEGYTDFTGSPELNQALAERRAHAVQAYLEADGIANNRIFTKGYISRPAHIADSTPRHARRVEVILHSSVRKYMKKLV